VPDRLPAKNIAIGGGPRRQHNRIGSIERREGLTQASGGNRAIVEIIHREQDYIEIASQAPMLEAVIEDVKLRIECSFRKAPGFVTTRSDDDRNLKPPGDQQGLVAKVASAASGLDDEHSACVTPISSGQDIECDAALFKQFSEGDDEWSFARSAH
jgi:hypothetical protein